MRKREAKRRQNGGQEPPKGGQEVPPGEPSRFGLRTTNRVRAVGSLPLTCGVDPLGSHASRAGRVGWTGFSRLSGLDFRTGLLDFKTGLLDFKAGLF